MAVPLGPEVLEAVAGQTFEEAAFAFTEPTEAPFPDDAQLVEASLSVRLPERHRLAVVTTSDFAIELAANLLGIEPDSAEATDQRGAALSEITNIMAGILLERCCQDGRGCSLGIPELLTIDSITYALRVENERLSVALLADDEHRLDVNVFAVEEEGSP